MDEDILTTMKKVFAMYDQEDTGYIETSRFPKILKQLGADISKEEIKSKVDEMDPEKTGRVNFENFCKIVMPLMEEEDIEAMHEELRQAFRIYDKDGQGYITPEVLKEILKELDNKLTNDDLDEIVEEVDADGSGTIDFDEFMEMMTG